MPDFLTLGISDSIVKKLNSFGVVKPTPIQEQAIPPVMVGRDVIAQAQTGTGKTFAFMLPILEKLNPDANHVQALIVTPTRELALQITDEFEKMTKEIDGVDVLAVYGGQDVDKQLKKLKKNVQIVVGTPGRLLDHIRRETIQLSEVSFLVLDEADQMLHIGFLNEVEDIIRETPDSRQTMLFSATMPEEIRKLAGKHMYNPQYIQVEKTQGPAENVKQIAIHTIDRAKQATLINLVETYRPYLAVIFCRTKRRVSKLYEVLRSHKFLCDELHGDLSQSKREQVMKRFRDGEIQLLIATDVAARGLDVEGVTHVFNYDIPQDAESYIHRIGRTGRAGMKGLAVTFYSSDDRATLDMIEQELNIRIQKQNAGNGKEKVQEKKDSTHPKDKDKKDKRQNHTRKPMVRGERKDKSEQKNDERRPNTRSTSAGKPRPSGDFKARGTKGKSSSERSGVKTSSKGTTRGPHKDSNRPANKTVKSGTKNRKRT